MSEFKAIEFITEYKGRTGLDRAKVDTPDNDSIYTYANAGPRGGTTVIDAWDPTTKTVMSLAAYTNDSLNPVKYNARWWRDTNVNMRLYLRALKTIPCAPQIL